MYRLASASRHLRSFIASATPRWWPPALARRVPPRFAAANPPARHDSRFPHGSRNMASSSGLKGEELGKPGRQPVDPSFKDFISSLGKLSAGTQGMKNVEHIDTSKELITRHSYVPPANSAEDERRASRNAISGNKYALMTTLEVIDNKPDITGEIVGTTDCELISESWAGEMPGHDEPIYEYILPDSSHRDGSIYRDMQRGWKRTYCIADRSETRLEATMFSDPIGCIIHNGTCMSHRTRHMLQIFSLRLDQITAEHGSVELYGYIAARDRLEPLLNYVVNFSRDDPIIVEQGSLINMAGPKRGIQLVDTTLIEYDMKIKTGKHEDEDLQLIDGVSFIDDMETFDRHVYTCSLRGDGGVVNLAISRIKYAVQATVEVAISQVRGKFIMQLGCFTSEIDEEIRIFDGAVVGSHGVRSSAVAVALDDHLDLRFKVAAEPCVPPAEHCCSFKASKHGHATEEIETGFALITVKVTWSTLGRLRS